MENQVLPALVDLLASPESHQHQSPSHPARAKAARPAQLVQLDPQAHPEPTARLDHLATQAQKANPAAMEHPVHPVQPEKPALLARMAHQEHPEKMDPKEARDPTDHRARPELLDQRERRVPMAPLEKTVNQAHLDLLEKPDRLERLDLLELPVNPVLRDHPASMPSTARARAAHSSTRSRRSKTSQSSLSSDHSTTTEFSFSTVNTLYIHYNNVIQFEICDILFTYEL